MVSIYTSNYNILTCRPVISQVFLKAEDQNTEHCKTVKIAFY